MISTRLEEARPWPTRPPSFRRPGRRSSSSAPAADLPLRPAWGRILAPPAPPWTYDMTTSTTLYATDEDIVLRASADFALLCPRDQKLASGTDGTFMPDDRWTLHSTAVDFA